MLTWKLWRALNRPPVRSPLYRRAYLRQQFAGRFEMIRIPLSGLFRNAGLVIMPIILILFGLPILVPIYYLSLLIAPLLLPLAYTAYGITLAANVGGGIARERERRTYDVLCTAPAGTLGMHWSYCTGWIHFHVGYRYVMLGVLSIGVVATIFGLASQVVFGVGHVSLAASLVRGLALGVICVVDYAQSVIISALLSLLVPSYVETETNVRLWAASLFAAIQIAVYLPTLLLAVYALPNTFLLLGVDPMLSSVLIPLLMVGFFLALRALIIAGLWHTVEQQLTTTVVELDALIGLAV